LNCVGVGKYVVTITVGAQIIIPDTIIVRQLEPIEVTANITDVSGGGNNGAINIIVSGGDGGYQFLWSNTAITQNITGLSPGPYSVTITDANGCVFVGGPYIVGDGNAVVATINHDCSQACTGSINITGVNCVAGPHTYQWSVPGQTMATLSDLCAGSYSVTVTGEGGNTCTATFQIVQPPSALAVAVDTMNETSAGNNGEIHLMVSGGQGPYQFNWNPSGPNSPDRTGLAGGSYNVTITDQLGCELIRTIILRGNTLFVDVVGSSFSGFGVSCAGECDAEILALPGNVIPPVTYRWNNGKTGQVIDDVCPGTYTVTVTDQLGSTAVGQYTVTEPPGMLLQLQITCASEPGALDGKAVTALSGGVPPYTYLWSDGSNSPSLQNISTGAYGVTVLDNNNCQSTRRFDICIEGIECYNAITVITPNGDGKNDQFVINCVYDLPSRLFIYNRYGGLEFEMEDYDNSWEGTDQGGDLLSDGGYHWVLFVNLLSGERRVHQGTVSVVRSLD
jgi:gliding motility-associated-like protein